MEGNEKFTEEDLNNLRKSLDGVFEADQVEDIISKAIKNMKTSKKPMEMDDDMMKAYSGMVSKMDTMKENMDMMHKAMGMYNGMKGKMDMMKKGMDGDDTDMDMDKMKKGMDEMEKAMTEFNDMYGKLSGVSAHGDDLKKSILDEISNQEPLKSEDIAAEIMKSLDIENLSKDLIEKSLGDVVEKFETIQTTLSSNKDQYDEIQKSLKDFADSPFGKMKAQTRNTFMERDNEIEKGGGKVINLSETGKVVDELEKAIKTEGLEPHNLKILQDGTMSYVASKRLPEQAQKLLKELNGVTIG